jgi:hypothetical protein
MRANAAYVVFERNETHRLWSRLHPDFNHCYVVVGFPNGYWVVLDQAYGVAKAMIHGPGVYGAIARTRPSAGLRLPEEAVDGRAGRLRVGREVLPRRHRLAGGYPV